MFILNTHLNVRDRAAGVLITAEAGGAARLLDGRSYAPGMSAGRLPVASGPAALDALSDALAAALGPE
jgi:fructose-1,6-bisphosphatase/inositol monophosphatase family enzyme